MPSPLARERNQATPRVLTASAGVDRVMCLCAEHSDDPTRRYSPEYQAYIEASQKGSMSRRRALRQGGQPLTASASGLTTEEDVTYAAWQGAAILDDLAQDQAIELLNSLEGD